MAQEITYVNTAKFEAHASSPSRKRAVSSVVMTLLALLALLLAVSLTAAAILYFQKEKKLQEIEGVMDKIRTSLWLSEISLSPAEASDSVRLLQNISDAFSRIQTRLDKIQGRHSDLLTLLSKGWNFYNGSLYFFSKEPKSWKEAEDACRAEGTHLVSITSKEEMEYLANKAGKESFWIGLSDQHAEGAWAWTDGTRYNAKLSFWGPRQPDNWHGAPQHKEDCVQFTMHWNDVSCTYSYKSFCKKVFS